MVVQRRDGPCWVRDHDDDVYTTTLIDVCFSIFSSIIPPHRIVFFSYRCVFFFSMYCVFFFFIICVKGADVTFVYYRLLDMT